MQTLSWYHEFVRLLYTDLSPDIRRRQYQIFKSLENILISLNNARSYVAVKLATEWLKLPLGKYYNKYVHRLHLQALIMFSFSVNIYLSDQDYVEMIEMVKYSLQLEKAQCCEFSLEYVGILTFLWDLIALRKYMCSKAAMEKMLRAVNVLPDDTKVIFLNYFDDYIKKFYI